MTIGTRLQQLRLSLGLSQEEFGDKLQVSRQTVSKWELDQAFPELAKIVQISRLFSVTTDSLLIDGITSFDPPAKEFIGGIYRGELCEIVETEKYTLIYECNADKTILTTALYSGYTTKKTLLAICQRNNTASSTAYAYRTEAGTVITNNAALSERLGEFCHSEKIGTLRRLSRFGVVPVGDTLPTVSKFGVRKALTAWRCGAVLTAKADSFQFSLCTDAQEYVLHIMVADTNVYCAASYNIVFDMGLFSAGQYFRIRHYKDNSAPFCSFQADFSFTPPSLEPPTNANGFKDECGTVWTVKRYNDDEIVLDGCGGDEYTYRRDKKFAERYTML